MSPFARLQEKLSALGRDRRFAIGVAAVCSLAILAVVFTVHREASRLHSFSQRIPAILAEADIAARNAVATELVERGTVTIDGVVVGAPSLASRLERLFGENGRLERIPEATAALVGTARPEWLPTTIADEPWLALAGGALLLAIVNFAAFSGLALPLAGIVLGAAAIGVPLAMAGRAGLALGLGSMPVLLFAFALLVRLLLLALDLPNPIFAVASGVVREAMRLRIAVAFAAIAVAIIPLLPQIIDPETPLRYQVQTFLSRSLDTMYIVCAFLTVFLGCATVAFEIRDRQAWMTLSKPVSRFSWLLGKWLGLVALNVAIVGTCSLAMYAFLVQVRARPAQDMFDALAVESEVLVARVGSYPEYKSLDAVELRTAVEEAIRGDPNVRADIEEGIRTELEVKKDLARRISEEFLARQRAIAPDEERVYIFRGLKDARDAGTSLSLRYRFYSGASDPHDTYPVLFKFGQNDRESWADRQFIAAQTNVVPVSAATIDDDGTLMVRIGNVAFDATARSAETAFRPGETVIAFDPDGLELLHRVGGFGDNFVRAQLVNLLKLSFLAMLAVTCASFLSFPVACLVVFTVFSAGSIAPFLATSVAEYRIRTDQQALKVVEAIIKGVAGGTEFAVRAFGEARANGPLVEGRLVPWSIVGKTLAVIGIGWSGILLVLGTIVFRRKELAIYSGQGG